MLVQSTDCNVIKNKIVHHLKHDAFIKKILSNQVAAQALLEYYLAPGFKKRIDLSKRKLAKETLIKL